MKAEKLELEKYAGLLKTITKMFDVQIDWLSGMLDIDDANVLAERIPDIITLVKTIKFLRSQHKELPSNIDADFRKKLYEDEETFEDRLKAFIELLHPLEDFDDAYKDYIIDFNELLEAFRKERR